MSVGSSAAKADAPASSGLFSGMSVGSTPVASGAVDSTGDAFAELSLLGGSGPAATAAPQANA